MSKQKKEKPITIETLVVIANLSNGKYHQVFLSHKTESLMQDIIISMEGQIKCLSKELEGIEIINP